MKKFIFMFLIIFSITTFSKTTINEILKNIKKNNNYNSSFQISTMKIEKNGKITSSMIFESYSKKINNNTFQLMKFTSPSRLTGTSILSKNGNTWYYNKRTNRVRLLSKSAKNGNLMGSSFSYDDMDFDYEKDFNSILLKEDKKYYYLKLVPIDKNKKYSYIISKVNKFNFTEELIEYYDKNNFLYKKLEINDYTKKGNYLIPKTMKMTDIINNKSTYIISDISTIKLNINIKNTLFSEKNLKK
ncbi:outer membrane lipoprotein-sorting protein [Hypnocyclicus thermotrophus]|uniref:Outer membrane lipoprotein-sorting protein n=1 Tax=Hypnocyclicus thermotrophus TaxID=1627895 RepID=A0AA46I5X4_9FUSO|nr:outer membrane lipoprotein-sorting protein [Hypnocyclicus thermotrophus]TDT71594.1 outer membrane lipoprotein-sorting protein [Hypnocyclicus thermotrophus]